MKIPFAKVDCSGNEATYVKEVLDSGWLTTASKAKNLEEKFCEFLGCEYALAVNSCTSGLHLALEALGIKEGDKVFVPSLTFTASAEVIRYLGADPIVLDVDYETGSLTVDILRAAVERHPETKCLIAVHYGGLALPMTGSNGILNFCRDNDISIVEDAAHALPAKWGEQLVGTFGDITVFSFYANKTMTTGEGGLVATDNSALADRIRLMRLHGIDRDVWARFTGESTSWEYDVVAPGYKYNMPDLNAAVGLAQFERLEQMHRRRISLARHYLDSLSDVDQIDLPAFPKNLPDHSFHLFAIRLNEMAEISRNNLINVLAEAGIGTSVHYKPIHQLKYYREKYELSDGDFPIAQRVWNNTLSLPIYNLMSDLDVEYVCRTLKSALGTR